MATEAQWINKKGELNKSQELVGLKWATENENIGALLYFPPDDTQWTVKQRNMSMVNGRKRNMPLQKRLQARTWRKLT
jgi:hypothetical protein